MRRGLIVWNPEEVTLEALDNRLARLRQAMAAANLDAMLLYTNFVRPAAVAYMSSFSPYWADALLYIPKEGEPVFATSMSTRMNAWIKTVNPVGEIINTRHPGSHVANLLVAHGDMSRVGVLELDGLPAGIYKDLAATASNVEFVEASDVFEEIRQHVDATEQFLLSKADTLARDALDPSSVQDLKMAGAVVGHVEQVARLGGAEEAYIALAPDLAKEARFARMSGDIAVGETFAVRASVAYKGSWIRRARTFSPSSDIQGKLSKLDQWFGELLANLDPQDGFAAQINASIKAKGWTQVSLLIESCIGTYPLQQLDDVNFHPKEGAFYVVSLSLIADGQPWTGAAPVLVGHSLFTEHEASKAA